MENTELNEQPKPKEEWRLVEGYEDYYISSRGRFKHGRKLRKISKNVDGYMCCNINGTRKLVHRLVAKAFIPNPDNLPVVDHIDGDKKNNNVENLRWVTIQENTRAAFELGLGKSGRKRDIIGLDPDHNAYMFESQAKAELHTGINRKDISKICRGIIPHRGGYRFFSIESFTDLRGKDPEPSPG